ncbi:hypothetical protein [Sulfurospirillum sp. 1612]|uniref:hypothetical protein n=1 Tax=Sulfurospirillum sp. 1612 TaxID=3094835 RepID=UPI002F9582E3
MRGRLWCAVFMAIMIGSVAPAHERDVFEDIMKPSIVRYYKNQKVIFLFFQKMENGNYYAIIKTKHLQECLTLDKTGKILSVMEDLNALDEVEEGC